MSIEHTSRTGADKGFFMVVPEDGCSTMNADWHNASINFALQNVSTVTNCAAVEGRASRDVTAEVEILKTRAGLFRAVGEPLEVVELDLAEPGPHDVVVRMAAVGICGTDLHQVKGEWQRPTPMVLGHEGAGIVEDVGRCGRLASRPGDEVVLSWAPSCGSLRRLRVAAARPTCVPLHRAIGNGTLVDGTTGMSLDGETVYRGTATGAWAERVVVSSQVALPTGGAVPLRDAALLGCAALTGVGAVLFAGRARARRRRRS